METGAVTGSSDKILGAAELLEASLQYVCFFTPNTNMRTSANITDKPMQAQQKHKNLLNTTSRPTVTE